VRKAQRLDVAETRAVRADTLARDTPLDIVRILAPGHGRPGSVPEVLSAATRRSSSNPVSEALGYATCRAHPERPAGRPAMDSAPTRFLRRTSTSAQTRSGRRSRASPGRRSVAVPSHSPAAPMPATTSPIPRQLSKQRCKSWSSGWRGSSDKKPRAEQRAERRSLTKAAVRRSMSWPARSLQRWPE